MVGWQLPGYVEVETLGSGGFGRVVLARHEASGVLVAIKYLHARFLSEPEILNGFRREASLLASVPSPYVVRVFDFVVQPEGAALVMEAVPGVSLRAVLAAGGALVAESALAVLKGSLLGLAAAHRVGVVHRDYKPDNVLVSDRGESKLVDFGLAVLDGQQGLSAGSPAYMAPEQWAGQPGTPATDVYAATCVFFQCITGERPFAAATSAEFQVLHATALPKLDAVPEHLRGLIARGMAKHPHVRPASAEAFVAELQAVAVQSYGPEWEQRGWQHLAAGAGTLLAMSPLALLATATTAGAPIAGAAGAGVGAGAAGTAAGTAGGVGAGAAGAGTGLLATTTAKVIAGGVVAAAVVVGGVVIIANAGEDDPLVATQAQGCTADPPADVAPGVDRSDCEWQASAEQVVGYGDQVVLVSSQARGDGSTRFVMRGVDAATGSQRWTTPPLTGQLDDPSTQEPADAERSLQIVHAQGKPYAAFAYTTDSGPAATFMPLSGEGKLVTWTGSGTIEEQRAAVDDALVAYEDTVPAKADVIDPSSGRTTSLPTAGSTEVQAVGDGWFAEGTVDRSSFTVKDYQGETLWEPEAGDGQRRVIAAYGDYALVQSSAGEEAVLTVYGKEGQVVAETAFGLYSEPTETTVLASPDQRWLVVHTDFSGAAINLEEGKATQLEDPPKPLGISDDGQVYGVVTGARDWAVVADGNTGQTTWTGDRATRLPVVAGKDYVVLGDVVHPALFDYPGRETRTVWALRTEPGPKPTEQPSEEPAPTGLDEGFIGSWQSVGNVDQPGSDTPYRLRVTLREGEVGDVVGEVSYPGLGCSGTWTLTSVGQERVELTEDITDDPENTCLSSVDVTVARDGDELEYSFQAQSGEKATARLERR